MPIRILLAVVIAALIAGLFYWNGRRECRPDRQAFRGEVWVQPNGTTLYYDGQCWTTKPMPPRDTPF